MRISLLYALRWRMLYSWMLSWMIMCHDESSDDVYFFSIIWCNQMLIGNVDWSLILILCMENVWCTLLWIRPWNICIVFLVIMRSWDSKLRLWVGFITRWTTWYQSNRTNHWLNWSPYICICIVHEKMGLHEFGHDNVLIAYHCYNSVA